MHSTSGRSPVDGDGLYPWATPRSVTSVTAELFPAVVRIDAAVPTFKEGRRTVSRGIGSGVIFDQDGHILTNFHVAGRATEIHITLSNKERVRGRLIGSDHWTDLAVLQLDMDEVRAKKIEFSHANFGDSSKLVLGQDVMAIGTPFGLARTLTLGGVSNVERTLYPDKLDIEGYETGGYSNWIQMDVPINPGNSGGPLVDLSGLVVGINTRGGAQNLNFAVPINTAKPVVASILATSTHDAPGRYDRSDLGIDFKPMQDLETFYNLDANRGVLINSVDQFSAAQKAGVESQDVLLSINGRPTNARFPEELAPLMQMIAGLPIGSKVELKLQRGGQVMTLAAVTDRLQGAIGEEIAVPDWGVSVSEVTRAYAGDHQLESAAGMLITSVRPDSPASKAGLMEDDVIRSIDGRNVGDMPAFRAMVQGTQHDHNPNLLLSLQRGRGKRSLVLKPTYASTHPDSAK